MAGMAGMAKRFGNRRFLIAVQKNPGCGWCGTGMASKAKSKQFVLKCIEESMPEGIFGPPMDHQDAIAELHAQGLIVWRDFRWRVNCPTSKSSSFSGSSTASGEDCKKSDATPES